MLEHSGVSRDVRAERVRDVSAKCIGALGLAELQLIMPAVIPSLVTSQSEVYGESWLASGLSWARCN